MATVTVRTPEPGSNDTVGGVRFVNGVAQVDTDANAPELRYFLGAGYVVEEPAEPAGEEAKTTRGRRAAPKDEETR